MRDFFGFNRAKHAVVEAAILATRLHLLPLAEVAAEFTKLRVIVGKTGGPDEHDRDGLARSQAARSGGGPMIRVVAPSRLHFGLFHVPPRVSHRPASALSAAWAHDRHARRRASTAKPVGSLAVRGAARQPGASVRDALHACRFPKPSADRFRFSSSNARPNTPASASARNSASRWRRLWPSRWGEPRPPSVELAARVGRGERSAIGVHGFDRGGLACGGGQVRG